jgi:hypothetical protein
MANPNIVNVTSILGATALLAPANTTANTLISNAASSGTILKVESLSVANITGSAALVTVSVNSAAAGGGTPFDLAFQISVPANSSLQVIDKNSFVYLTENTSLVVTSGTSAALEYVASYEIIS